MALRPLKEQFLSRCTSMSTLTELHGVACGGSVEETGGVRETRWRQSGADRTAGFPLNVQSAFVVD